MRLYLTRRGDYAVRAMLALAESSKELLSSAEIARRTQIPARFVVQIMGELVRAELVVARVGRGGGYRLARPAASVSMLAIVDAVEGDSRRVRCVLHSNSCATGEQCAVHQVFAEAEDALVQRLAASTLAASLRS
jgi:Rrf2 family protein